MNIVPLNAGPKPPSDLSTTLRLLADAVDRGQVTQVVCAYVDGDERKFVYGASIVESLVLARLLDELCVERFKK